MKKAGTVYTGTSGWSFKHWKGPFYPEDIADKNMLAHYCRSFLTVEINNSFYRLPLMRTFENWRDSSPPGFVFAVKAGRYITHVKRLKDCGDAVEKLFESVSGLGGKIGPVLFQLPPSLKINVERLSAFLGEIPAGYRCAFEFRNPSWFDSEVYSLLRERGAAFCISELGGRMSPVELTGDFAYIRLHGPGEAYQGSYPGEILVRWAERFANWSDEGADVYCYFDNDEKGFAPLNAMELQKILEARNKAA